jgi:fucose 4-O-acetylase-like acetyltransferase
MMGKASSTCASSGARHPRQVGRPDMDNAKDNRIPLIYACKCIAIVLVVAGHYRPLAAPAYWLVLRDIIYKFHMPIFFMLSGYLFHHTLSRHNTSGFLHILTGKLKRLGLPYLTIALLFFGIKYFSQMFFSLEHPVNLATLWSVVVNPANSYMPLLWYMYSLLLMYTILLAALRCTAKAYYIFALATAGYILMPSIDDTFSLLSTASNFPFFLFGYLIASKYAIEEFARSNRKYIILTCIVFGVAYSLHLTTRNIQLTRVCLLILGISGILFANFLSSYILDHRIRTIFCSIGYYSMTIYLLHPMFESAVRILLYQKFKISDAYFLPGAGVAMSLGLCLPLLFEKHLIRRNQLLRMLFLGVSA